MILQSQTRPGAHPRSYLPPPPMPSNSRLRPRRQRTIRHHQSLHRILHPGRPRHPRRNRRPGSGPRRQPSLPRIQWRPQLDQPRHRPALRHRTNRLGRLLPAHLTLRPELRQHPRKGRLQDLRHRPRQQALLRQPHHRRRNPHRSHRHPSPPFHPPRSRTRRPRGSFYIYDETLFDFGGDLYANFDTGSFDPTTFTPTR